MAIGMDELLDVVDEHDRVTGIRKSKGDVHRDGDWHRASHVWIYNDRGEILFQRRAPAKDTFPGLWDITGGHVAAGETYHDTAIRELDEELGVSVTLNDLEPLYIHRDLEVNREFQHVFLLRLNCSPGTLRLQEEEVAEVRYFGIDGLRTLLRDEQCRRRFCPVYDYYLRIIDIIEARIKANG